MNHDLELPAGPFRNEDEESNVKPYRHDEDRRPIDHARFQREMLEYFEGRLQKLRIVQTTTTPQGQTLDWIPIESQDPRGEIASPPPAVDLPHMRETPDDEQPEHLATAELEHADVERGPEGTVPILRKNLQALGYTKSLKKYLSKSRGHRIIRHRGMGLAAPEVDGNHRYASSSRQVICFGGEGHLSCFSPYTETSDDFSLIQTALSNSDLGFLQTIEAGWQESQDIYGDWVPHLFTYYTTNGYSNEGDDIGGYNTDVDGWVQRDDTIFPGTTFTPYSTRGGAQTKITIKYQLFQDNWWLACQGRWVGYYPARLFMGNSSVFSTLGDHADHIHFYGEIYDSEDVSGRTGSDMGSGYFPDRGWTWAAYMHHLLVQTDRGGSMANYDGSSGVWNSDPDMYLIDPHFNSGTDWGSYVYLGGPGAG